MRQQHTYLLVLIILVLIVGMGIWYVRDSNLTTPSVAPVVVPTTAVNDTVYTNQQYGFSMKYDSSFVTDSSLANTDAQWSNNSSFKGSRIVALHLPREFQPKTNFSEAVISVGVSTDLTAVSHCLTAQNGETVVSDQSAQAKGFEVFKLGDAGAGNYYETTSYRIVRDKACLALETIVHSTNIGNYDPSQGIHEFDHGAVDRALAAVVNSFSFTK